MKAPAPVSTPAPTTPTVPVKPTPTTPTAPNPDALFPWDQSVANNRHNVRALCDLAGLGLKGKNLISALVCIESGFQNYYIGTKNPVINHNILNGRIVSTDWGIVQCNDAAHIGPGKDFASTDYVLGNPTRMIDWMIEMYKIGRIGMWSSYKQLKAGEHQAVAAEFSVDITSI